jgi:hypothetical protein
VPALQQLNFENITSIRQLTADATLQFFIAQLATDNRTEQLVIRFNTDTSRQRQRQPAMGIKTAAVTNIHTAANQRTLKNTHRFLVRNIPQIALNTESYYQTLLYTTYDIQL